MPGMRRIDFHCHILPNADHGSDSVETSLEQVRNAISADVECVFATPHFYPLQDSVSVFLERRAECYEALLCAMEEQSLSLDLQLGGEIALSHSLPEMDGLEKLCIGNSRYLLLEMPNTYWTQWEFDAIYYIESVRRITPIIAHVDRYDPKQVQRLFDMSLLTQVNAGNFIRFSRRHQMKRWVNESSIHFLGSDTHGSGQDSFPIFARACELMERIDDSFMDRSFRILEEARRDIAL